MHQLSNFEAILRISCAIFCGGAIGWERERREKSAGLRTHIFVAMGSALIMIVSAHGFNDVVVPNLVTLDPSRIAAQVVSGISFLGAGVIWFNKSKVRGLDTAAGIWATSAVGLAIGAGMYLPALLVASVVLTMNMMLKPIEQRLFPSRFNGHASARLLILLRHKDGALEEVKQVVEAAGLKVNSMRLARDKDNESVGLDVGGPSTSDWLSLASRLQALECVRSISVSEPTIDGYQAEIEHSEREIIAQERAQAEAEAVAEEHEEANDLANDDANREATDPEAEPDSERPAHRHSN